MNREMENFYYRLTDAKPLFDSPEEQSRWAENFRESIEPALKENARKRAMSEMRAKTDVRTG